MEETQKQKVQAAIATIFDNYGVFDKLVRERANRVSTVESAILIDSDARMTIGLEGVLFQWTEYYPYGGTEEAYAFIEWDFLTSDDGQFEEQLKEFAIEIGEAAKRAALAEKQKEEARARQKEEEERKEFERLKAKFDGNKIS